MECPRCKSETEQGYLYQHGTAWRKGRINGLGRLMMIGELVIAWRCPKCKKIELETEK